MKKAYILLVLALLCPLYLFGQSASDIEAAKSLARSYGYSESEINAAAGRLSADSKTNVTGTSGTTDRTTNLSVRSNSANLPMRPGYVAIDEVTAIENGGIMLNTPKGRKPKSSDIWGHSYFVSDGLSYIPGFNVPAPDSYTLGPGDELDIDIWGSATTSFSGIVNSDGSIHINGAGPVFVAGLTLSKAENAIKSRLAKIYSGLADGSAKLSISIGHLRAVSVYVLGEVATPGVYTLSSLSSIATAVFIAGGVKKNSSVRDIRLYRSGSHLATFDLYDFILNGKYETDMRLQDGDIVSVQTIGRTVEVTGAVVRPAKFEIREGETLDRVIRYAGSFTDSSYRAVVHIDRSVGGESSSFDVPEKDFGTFVMNGGDLVSVRNFRRVYDASVVVKGAVRYEGAYTISDTLDNVKELIAAAGGLRDGAFTDYAFIRRMDDDRIPSSISFSLKDVLQGDVDVPLKGSDTLQVFYTDDLREKTTVSVRGAVNSPGDFAFRTGMTLGEALLLAKGCTGGANMKNVEIASRGQEGRGKVVSINVEDNPEAISTPLSPYDMVFVREFKHYGRQQTITVRGEVKYPGTYVIDKSEVKLSDVIARAGGVTEEAFVRGGKLTRTLNEIEYERLMTAIDVARQQNNKKDTTLFNFNADAIGDSFLIAVNLEDAINTPGSYSDVVLRSGDVIEVPQFDNTVKVSGAVYFPNTLVYNKSYTLNDYLDHAGGCIKGARRNKIYVVYMNGLALSRKSKDFRLEPGMEIVVPQKQTEGRRSMTAGEIAALASTTTSVASLIAILINALIP